MKNFRPLNLKTFQVVYNGFLVLLSLWLLISCILHSVVLNNFGFRDNPLDTSPRGVGLSRILWVFFWSKAIEFMDTFIMVLKKSDRQITFLHLYHHSSIILIWWAVVYYGPGGDAYLSVILNSAIHTVMYTYYMLASLGVQLNAIKPFITISQMTQFAILFTQSSLDVIFDYQGNYPRFLVWTLLIYMITLLILFMNFFIKDRQRSRELRRKSPPASTPEKLKKRN